MEEILFRAFKTLFLDFDQYGYYNEKEISKVLALTIIRDMLLFDFFGFLEDKDIRIIEKATNQILGESCILSFVVNENKC